jgi:uncharacterized zinc-type alcohol dehydrogenase-like protein
MEVTVFSSTEGKREEALGYGASYFYLGNEENKAKNACKFDLVMCTTKVYSLGDWMNVLKPGGKQIIIGAPDVTKEHTPLEAFDLIFMNRGIFGSLVGSVANTAEILRLSARFPDIRPVCETVPFNIDEGRVAFTRLHTGTPTLPKYRLVWDIQNAVMPPAKLS